MTSAHTANLVHGLVPDSRDTQLAPEMEHLDVEQRVVVDISLRLPVRLTVHVTNYSQDSVPPRGFHA